MSVAAMVAVAVASAISCDVPFSATVVARSVVASLLSVDSAAVVVVSSVDAEGGCRVLGG
jgi:anti-sigma-K factor RskA